MTWTVQIAAPGAVYRNHTTSVFDVRFADRLYGMGDAAFVLGGLQGLAVPAEGEVVRIVWNLGLPSEEIHWIGYVDAVMERSDMGPNSYQVNCLTLDGLLHEAQTGLYRRYQNKTPYTIIQAAGIPSPLLVNDQGSTVIAYGTAAVPNIVNAGNPGTALDFFIADSTSLLANVQRLGLQHKDTSGTVTGLEWTTTLEGANNSSPRFYLVERRIRATGYTPETLDIPTDLHTVDRGNPRAVGVEAVRVIGGGSGDSLIQSARAGTGTREKTFTDKSIVDQAAADNMAVRLLEIYDKTTESITALWPTHGHATRAGDDVVVTQTGKPNATLRVVERHYLGFDAKHFVLVLGRPLPEGADILDGLQRSVQAQATAPQKRGYGGAGTGLANDAALPNNASLTASIASFNPQYEDSLHDGISVFVEVDTDSTGDHDLQIQLQNSTQTLNVVLERFQAQSLIQDGSGRNIYQKAFFIDGSLLANVGAGINPVQACIVKVTNRTGANRDIVITARATLAGG